MENDVVKKKEKEDGVVSEPVVVKGSNIENVKEPNAIDTDIQIHDTMVTTADAMKIENGKNKMKIRCAKCKIDDTLSEDDIKLLAHIVKRYNPNPRPGDYTAVLSIIKGNCSDGNKHLFIFDEEFDKAVVDILKEYKDTIAVNVARKETLEKLCILIVETTNQIKSLESALKDFEKKREYTIAEMKAGGILIDNIRLKFSKLTGTEDTEMWS